jgi:hypothetical protein
MAGQIIYRLLAAVAKIPESYGYTVLDGRELFARKRTR